MVVSAALFIVGVYALFLGAIVAWCKVARHRIEHNERGPRSTVLADADLRRRLREDREVARLDALFELPAVIPPHERRTA